ncbi:MAG: DNA/RNA non-specific endonuclease [Pseudobdellovibrio sp.]
MSSKPKQNLLNLFIVVSLNLISLAGYSYDSGSDVIGNVSLNQNVNASEYTPVNINKKPEVLISRDTYLISFNPDSRLLNWAAWKLELSDIGHFGRTNNFLQDPDLQNYLARANKQAVDPTEFSGSCFDRGHQVPSADRDTSQEVNQLTFLMSNMIPQTAYLNRVIWEHLEAYTRTLVVNQGKKVYVIAGPIYDEDFGKIGPNKDIPVPSKNFKILIVLDKNQTINDINAQTQIISVIMPNILKTGEKPMDNRAELCKESGSSSGDAVIDVNDWQKFQVPLPDIEKAAGFKIAPGL